MGPVTWVPPPPKKSPSQTPPPPLQRGLQPTVSFFWGGHQLKKAVLKHGEKISLICASPNKCAHHQEGDQALHRAKFQVTQQCILGPW